MRDSTGPIRTEPNTTHYEWAGATLQRLLGADRPVSETWAFFSGPSQPAHIAGAGGRTMADLVAAEPAVLGPAGADPAHRGQKYFFVKFLDPSDFPAFAYVGFTPGAAGALGDSPEALRARVAELLWQDRQALETFAALVRPQVGSREVFARLKAAYKAWAVEQARANWTGEAAMDLAPFVDDGARPQALALLARQRDIRRALTGALHRIDFEEDQAVLVETPALHAIAGLSLQLHPKAPGNFHPKDELWMYKPIALPGGGAGWILVEPQRTFDKTESGADFFTPFAWEGPDRGGRLAFRKPITKVSLDAFVALMDATPHPRDHYIRRASPMMVAGGTTTGRVQWYRVVEEPGWPHFLVRELRFEGPGEATAPLDHRCFAELHATRGAVEVALSRPAGGDGPRFTVTPPQPAFLPASLPHETLIYRADAPATLLFFTR